MTNFEKNWDYMKHRPVKKLKKQEESKNQKDAFQTFFLCFSSNKRNSGGLSQKGSQLKELNSSSVTFLLDDFWRFGIPVTSRKALWPFAVQNKLGLSKQLYRIKLAEGLLRSITSPQVDLDLESFYNDCCMGGGPTKMAKMQTAKNVISALLVFRPDIEYLKVSFSTHLIDLEHFILSRYISRIL